MATLRNGPAGGLKVDDERDLIWVAYRPNCYGRPVPLTTPDGYAQTLPDGIGPETEALVNHAGGRWACYRRIGAKPDGIDVHPGDDLPYPSDGQTAYRWVCRRPR